MNQHYNADPSSDEGQALQLLAMSIKATKAERISPLIVRWTFGETVEQVRYIPIEPTSKQPREESTNERVKRKTAPIMGSRD